MTTEELQLRRLTVCASGLLYWGGVLILARRVRKQIGHSPNLKPRGSREKALWLGWFAVIVVWIGQPWVAGPSVTTPGLAFWPGLLHPAALAAGLALVVLGYAGTLWSYASMGNTWRIGIDAKEKTVLVSHGLYRWVRHPIYMLQIVMLTGAALLLPTPVSWAILALHLTCALIKARSEENYLRTVHGTAYTDYMARTGGLVPRLFRRRSPPADFASRKIVS